MSEVSTTMAHSSSRPNTTAVLPDDGQDVLRFATCPMCHTPTSVTQGAIGDGYWRCVRCGQNWDGTRLAAVASYAAWVADREVTRDTEGREDAAVYRDSQAARLDATL